QTGLFRRRFPGRKVAAFQAIANRRPAYIAPAYGKRPYSESRDPRPRTSGSHWPRDHQEFELEALPIAKIEACHAVNDWVPVRAQSNRMANDACRSARAVREKKPFAYPRPGESSRRAECSENRRTEALA